ncbi:glycosyltransferase family 4 protein [Novosphingobium beihaiensis]|uniref:Glycosyltransferase family 4 protein n=1 Tax=Novosphingobium beihaiensis TaxID=2930389 RepID=A0ABT0BTJ1_9SPHN|nr:glycosyltransferase family 1 protein [Novosphingobium beihaiensis]MCJ2188380.1 glycosyltransferase family 4 protein [Novosphingobium beihaiensis]
MALPGLSINGKFLIQATTGVQRVAREITREIDEMLDRGELRTKVTLLVPPGSWTADLELKHIEVKTIGRLSGFLWEQLELPRHAGADLLLCLGNTAPVAMLKRHHSRIAVVIHDVSYLDFPDAYKLPYRVIHRALLPLLLTGAREIFTVSRTERRRLARINADAARRTTVVPNGSWRESDPPPSPAPLKLRPGYALYVGSLSLRKNFKRILDTAIRLAREDGMEFLFVGETARIMHKPDAEVPADVAGRIHFLGQIDDRDELARIYAQARVMVFPSLYEASPLPPLEAAYFRCPVVVSNIPSMWERCGQAAAYCDPHSTDSIVSAVREVLSDPHFSNTLAAAGHRVAAARLWADQARAICAKIMPESVTPEALERIHVPDLLRKTA